jgi:transcriptional regulator with XRE-family HTH domain
MSKKLENYLRAHRKRSGLSQDEVAFLLGTRSGTKVSRYESFIRTPALRTALGLAAIYRTPAGELFAGPSEREKHRVASQARVLVTRLEKNAGDRRTARKVATLKAIVAFGARNER